MNWFANAKRVLVISSVVVLLSQSCGRPDGSVETETPSQNPKQPPPQTVKIIDETQNARLMALWIGLFSESDDQRKVAIEMLRDNLDLSNYSIRAENLAWISNTHLAPVIHGGVLDFREWRNTLLRKQDIPALALRSPPFVDWKPEVCSRTMLALQKCSINMRLFARSLISAQVPKEMAAEPPEVALLTMQFDICLKTRTIRDAILRSAENAHLPGFDAETLRNLRRELSEDGNADNELLNKLVQERNNWMENLRHMIPPAQ
ncbi:MAG: hypothetical protein K8R92_02945 [Planctomycetes bacterium]|nr:hypothetical protein [Planctomycetota bacterium]